MARNNDMAPTGNLGQVNTALANLAVQEFGSKYNHTTVLTLGGSPLPAIAGGANLAVGRLLYTFPAGAIRVTATKMSVAVKQTQGNITADTPDIGIGTTIGSGAVAVLGGTAAFENILTGQTAADCNGTATVKTVDTSLVIESSGDHTVYLNIADGWAASGDTGALLSGTVTIHWQYLG
jgi:hypothetical protein